MPDRNDLPTAGPSRRHFLAGAGAAVGAAGAGAALAGGALAPVTADASPLATAGRRSSNAVLRQGTDIAAAVSPDGRTIAFDAVGVLWTVPSKGGTANRLTDDFYDIAQPDWSPDGRSLVFQSYRDGIFNLWTIRADGSGLRQLTHGPYDHREPRWSPDGRHIAFSSDLAGSYAIYTYDVRTGAVALITDTAVEEYEPAWASDSNRLAFVVADTSVAVVDLTTGARTTPITVPKGQVIHAPAFVPHSDEISYTLVADGTSRLMRGEQAIVSDEEVFPFRAAWRSSTQFVYTANGEIRRRTIGDAKASVIAFSAGVSTVTPQYTKRRRDFTPGRRQPVVGIGSPVLSPDGRNVAFRALNDIYTMRMGHKPVPLTRDSFWKSDPDWSPDGKSLAYSSDRGGKLEIWVRTLRTGKDRRVAALPKAAAVSGRWSPDGKHIAFLDQTGALYTVELATGDVQRVYQATFEPGRPTWSPDGTVIALAAIKPYSARYREGLSEILTVNRLTGEATYHQAVPDRSLQTRGDDGPVWSPNGRYLAFVVASCLWVMPVAADGTPTGRAEQITDEVTDAPSWSGDSKSLLYLSLGKLRLVGRGGGRPHTVPVALNWANAEPGGRTVVRAGRVWDGVSQQLRDDVDIVIDANRIVAVEDHRDGRAGKQVDARKSVVIPGLVDIHNHREMQGYSYGDRQGRVWLSLGITTTRSPGSPAYQMVEERESVQAGLRVGPRYFATGEAVDGSRIFYNFMRPTYDEDQLELEFARATALDYDLMKSYVRLSPERQQKLIDYAHRRGIHATSHYHYPALAFGGDQQEHIGATNRFGYSRTVTALGTGYSDVSTIFGSCGAARTPTLFGAAALFRDDTSLVTDRRVTTLYPSWEYATLQASVATAKASDQSVNLANLQRQVQQIKDQLRAGGRIVTGTDSPIDHTAVSTHMNLRAMVKYGISPYQALVTATSASGEFLNEPIGRIAAGMLADLSFLGGDPLRDITRAADVQRVMTNGRLYTVDDLLAPFAGSSGPSSAQRFAAGAGRAPAANKQIAPTPTHPSSAAYWWHDPHYLQESKNSCCQGQH